MRKLRTWREYLIKHFAEDWDAALDYIQFAMEEYQVDGDTEVFLLALYTFVESQGGVAEVAKRAAMSPGTLSKILSSEEAPHLDTLAAVLKALGCRLAIVPLKADEYATTDTAPVPEVESKKVGDSQTQLIESDSSP
ncbi:helix-turn-helix domain-containing protein [Candidatus Poribacteria bacterium]|nr:helix-turn-helix domain-containing protein [Candidatus Poribacteria bacterium]